jgi:hypothetical protein
MGIEYSKAFERLVRPGEDKDEDDLVGLLAYAYYKRDKRDLVLTRELSEELLKDHYKTLTPGLIEQYRESALRRLESYAQTVVATVEPEIRETTRVEAITTAKNEMIAAVESSTKWWLSILWNVVAWLISLAITFLVIAGLGKITIGISPN